MKTLLEQVRDVEDKADEKITKADSDGKKKIANLLSREEKTMAEIGRTATIRGKTIIKERVSKAKSELNLVNQDETNAITAIKEVAQKNRRRTVSHALGLFQQDYLSKNNLPSDNR